MQIKFLLTFLFINIIVFSQNEITTDTIQVNHIGQEKGLLQINVKDIEQDGLEYLWLSTEDGLHRFNGLDFKVYLNTPLDSLSIPEDHTRDTFIVNDTLFAVSNTKGVFGFKLSTDSFFKISESSKTDTGYKVLPVNKKYLLFSIRNYFLLFNRKTKQVVRVNLPQNKAENYVQDILKVNSHTFILATTKSGLLSFNLKDLSLKLRVKIDNSSHNILFKNDSGVFVGTDEGFYAFDYSKTDKFFKILDSIKVSSIYKKNQNALWIGSNKGVFEFNTITRQLKKIILQNQRNESYNPLMVNDIKGDDKGNIWIGTEVDGLLHFNAYQKKFNTLKLRIPKLSRNTKISSFQFLPSKDSSFFIGTSFGILSYKNKTKQFKYYKDLEDVLIYTLKKDFNDNIWAGGFTSGLLKYDSKNDTFNEVKIEKGNIPNRDVIEIRPLDSSELLVATWSSGLYIFNIDKNEFREYPINGKPLNRARISFVDSKNQIWLGTDDGVFKITKEKEEVLNLTTDSHISKLSSNRIFGIAEDSKGNMWFGTSVGLTKLNVNTNSTNHYYKQEGLPNDFVYTVLIDKKDNIWVSTNMGISVLNSKTNTFTNYLAPDGLQNNEFNGKAAFEDKFGNFYFGGVDGVNVFHPEKLRINPYESKVYIESLELFNSPINNNELYVDALEFKSDENVLTINYASINYLNPEKVNYAYYLEGFDKTWRPVTQDKNTTYTNLNPGNYIFKIKATNDVGLWSKNQDQLKIKIIPPWYNTLWFKVTAVLLFLLSGVLFFLNRTRKLKKEKIKLEALVKNRTKEVLLQKKELEKEFIKSEEQKESIKFLMRELRHRVKNNLQIVSSLLNIQTYSIEDKNAVDSLRVAKNRILTISHLEDKISVQNEGIALQEFTVDVCNNIIKILSDENSLYFRIVYEIETIQIRSINTMIYGLILNELITNTVKYAFDKYNEKNELRITCFKEGSYLKLVVEDNGKGYDTKVFSKNSLGIDLVKDMVAQLDGEISISVDDGVKNSIIIPLEN